MLYKVFDFADKEVHEVMVPRPEVVAISVTLPTEEALAALLESPYTRYPVYRESLDEIVGILHVRDLFSRSARPRDRAGGDRAASPSRLHRPGDEGSRARSWPSSASRISTWRSSSTSTAPCRGSSRSRTSSRRSSVRSRTSSTCPDESVERIDDTHIRIDGTFPIDDFNEQFGTEIEVEDYHTMAGIVFGEIGRAPEVGDEVTIDGLDAAGDRDRGLPHSAAGSRVPREAPRTGAGGGVACFRSSVPAR